MENKSGLRAQFYECEDPAGERVLLTVIKNTRDEHQSYPNRMHGGIAAALLDEAIGRTFSLIDPEAWGVTMDLTTRYRKPTPLDKTLYIESKITGETSRGFDGEGRLFTADGTTLVTATGRYFRCPIEQIAGASLDHSNWFFVEEDLPEYIEIA
jgi:acyl-coenzyme A thioesterase PaaI-like protein